MTEELSQFGASNVTPTLGKTATTPVEVTVTPSTAAGSFVVTGFPDSVAGTSQLFSVEVRDAFGNFIPNYQGTVTFRSSDAQASMPASYTFTAADAGRHQFSAAFKTAGTQSITVLDASNPAVQGNQAGIRIGAADVASLSVAGFSATTAGQSQTVTVAARDSYGNIVPNYQGTVIFSSSDLQAGLPSSYTFTAADAGVHTFSATLKTAGIQSISVRDSIGITGVQTGINVGAAAAARFAISAPTSVIQGAGFKLTVTVLDAYGNLVNGYRGKVRLSSSDPKGGKTDYSFSSRDNGVATLSFSLSTLGLQTLTVTDTSGASISGKVSVNVVPKR